ncbi:MAG: hypothetical protein HC770_09885 [Pseudanabaena sp. CRU_2_10]|nr:hypothetical protein [Pseudanabaena sp. CRU_2_10]
MALSRARMSPNLQTNDLEATKSPSSKGSIKTLPDPNAYPVPNWLKFLVGVQRLSIATTVLLTIAVFGVYSWTVYAQESWNNQYRKLEDLKRLERNLTATEGLLEHSMIGDAQKTSKQQLIRETPGQAIFLQSAPARPLSLPSQATEQQAKTYEPLGY